MLRTLHWDVTRQMVQAALECDEVIGLDVDPETTTTAGVLRNLLGRIWPLDSPATLQDGDGQIRPGSKSTSSTTRGF